MALPANALTTVATVAVELGITPTGPQTTVLERLIGVMSDNIEDMLGRELAKATVTNEYLAGRGTQRVLVQRTPIISLTSVTMDGSAITGVVIEHAEAGILYLESGFQNTAPVENWDGSIVYYAKPGPGERRLAATYVGGYVLPWDGGTRTLPMVIEQACIDGVVQAWRNRGRYSNLQSASEAEADVTWRGEFIPAPHRRALEKYKRRI